jgi:hypothetical protein
MARECSTCGGRKGMHIRFWWKARTKEITRKPRRRWEDGIEMVEK